MKRYMTLKQRKFYKFIDFCTLSLIIATPVSLISSALTYIAGSEIESNLVEKYQQNTDVSKYIISQEEEVLNNYKSGLISEKEYNEKIKEIRSSNNILTVAEEVLGESAKKENDKLDKLDIASAGLLGAGLLSGASGIIMLTAFSKRPKTSEIDEYYYELVRNGYSGDDSDDLLINNDDNDFKSFNC